MRTQEPLKKCFKTFLMQVKVTGGYINTIQIYSICKMVNGIAMAK